MTTTNTCYFCKQPLGNTILYCSHCQAQDWSSSHKILCRLELSKTGINTQSKINWFWQDDDKSYKPFQYEVSQKLDNLLINNYISFLSHYRILKTTKNKCIQTNIQTGYQRNIIHYSLLHNSKQHHGNMQYQLLIAGYIHIILRRLKTEMYTLPDINKIIEKYFQIHRNHIMSVSYLNPSNFTMKDLLMTNINTDFKQWKIPIIQKSEADFNLYRVLEGGNQICFAENISFSKNISFSFSQNNNNTRTNKYNVLFQSHGMIVFNDDELNDLSKGYYVSFNKSLLFENKCINQMVYSCKYGVICVQGFIKMGYPNNRVWNLNLNHELKWKLKPKWNKMKDVRYDFLCTLINDKFNDKLVIGCGEGEFVDFVSFEIFDFNTNKWSTLNSSKNKRNGGGIYYDSFYNKIFIGGGKNKAQKSVECYDINTNRWVTSYNNNIIPETNYTYERNPILFCDINMLYIFGSNSQGIEFIDLRMKNRKWNKYQWSQSLGNYSVFI